MRLIIEILILIGAGLIIYFLLNKNQDISGQLKDSKQTVEQLNKEKKLLDDSISVLEEQRNKYKEENKKLKEDTARLNREKKENEKAYNDSIEAIQKAKLSDLADSSQIIKKGDTIFVLVSESFYRRALSDRVRIKKLKSLVGIYRQETQVQRHMLGVKDKEISNLVEQIAVHKQKETLNDSIIEEKDKQVELKDKVIRKVKLQRNIGIGIGGAVIILLLL